MESDNTSGAISKAVTTKGRDPTTGQFLAGNGAGRGNPISRRRAELDRLWCEAVTEEQALAFIRAIYADAMNGDRVARLLLADRLFGRVPAQVEASIDHSVQKTYVGVDLDAV